MALFKITVSERYEKTFYQEAADKEEAEDMILSEGINMTDEDYVFNSTLIETVEYLKKV